MSFYKNVFPYTFDFEDDIYQQLVNYMDDDLREKLHRMHTPCFNRDAFMSAYLREDPDFAAWLAEFDITTD